MGKHTPGGLAKKDDPIFRRGVMIYTPMSMERRERIQAEVKAEAEARATAKKTESKRPLKPKEKKDG